MTYRSGSTVFSTGRLRATFAPPTNVSPGMPRPSMKMKRLEWMYDHHTEVIRRDALVALPSPIVNANLMRSSDGVDGSLSEESRKQMTSNDAAAANNDEQRPPRKRTRRQMEQDYDRSHTGLKHKTDTPATASKTVQGSEQRTTKDQASSGHATGESHHQSSVVQLPPPIPGIGGHTPEVIQILEVSQLAFLIYAQSSCFVASTDASLRILRTSQLIDGLSDRSDVRASAVRAGQRPGSHR